MKKLALAFIASTIFTGAASANHLSTGTYIGAALGYGATTGKLVTTSSALPITTLSGSRDIGGNQANIGAYVGYGWVAGCLYIGGEFGYTFENAKINDNLVTGGNGGLMSVKRNGYFDLALRGGYLFVPNTMMYIRLGMRGGKWTINDSLNTQFTSMATGTGSKSRLSFAPGIGLETAIHKHVYVRVEYVYEFGPSVRATNSNFTNAYTNVSTIRNQAGKVGLSYKF